MTGTADYSVCNYTYDNNNRLTSSSWYDNDYMNRITSYRYDNNGNMTYKHTEQYYDDFAPEDATVIDYPDDTAYYVYNVSNELTRVNRNSVITTYNYDPTGQRISKTVGGATTNDIWDNSGNIVAENDTIYNRGLGGEIISAKGFGDSAAAVGDQYYSYNGHGDTTNLVQQSGTTLAMTGAYEYDAFGNCRTSGSEGSANPFRYNGQYYDEEIGLYYLRNRYYDPSIGRFTQEDTYWNVNNMIYGDSNSNVPSYSAIAQSSNLYVYCANAPVNFVDPFGLVSVIFVANDMRDQAEVRKSVYQENYGTDCYVISVDDAKQFAEQWNLWFTYYLTGETIDAIEIISHGGAVGDVGKDAYGTSYATGFLYFSEDPNNNRLMARDTEHMNNTDASITWLDPIWSKVDEFNINGCNSANPDVYNIVYGFMQKVDSYNYTGFDGGAEWNWDVGDHVRGGGEYGTTWRHPFNPAYYVENYQATWWKYVNKNNDGSPSRYREGRRWFQGR